MDTYALPLFFASEKKLARSSSGALQAADLVRDDTAALGSLVPFKVDNKVRKYPQFLQVLVLFVSLATPGDDEPPSPPHPGAGARGPFRALHSSSDVLGIYQRSTFAWRSAPSW